jgi:uncharacterized protein (DUF169 family)
MINKLKSRFGKRCSGIKINPPELGRVNVAEKQMKFCEAVYYSFKVPVQIDKNNIYCAGAKRNLGYGGNDDSLAKKIAGNNNIPLNFILSALQNIPALKKNEYKIVLGITEEMEKFVQPDVFIIYAKPASIMQIIHDYARKEIKADISPYSLLSICGNVFIKSYMEGNINISFGCPESREFGGVDNEEVIIGVPYKMALLINSENKANDNKIQ